MSLRLISKKNDSVGVTVDVDAAIHNEAFHGQNGAVYGFYISLESGYIKAANGLLSVRGFLFETDVVTNLFNLSAYSAADAQERILYLVITYDKTNRDTSFEFEVKLASASITQTNIDRNTSGSYYYPIAKFTKNGNEVTSFESKVQQIAIGASGGEGGTGLYIPTPVLACTYDSTLVESAANKEMWKSGVLLLWNIKEFEALKNRYKVKLQFIRRLQKGEYSHGQKKHYKNTHWAVSGNWGWGNGDHNFNCSFNLSTNEFTADGIPLATIENAAFFAQSGSTKTAIPLSGTDSLADSYWFRATRSKVRKYNGSIIEINHNFVEIAVRIEVYDPTSNALIAISPVSNSVTFLPIRELINGSTLRRRIIVKMG